MTPMKFAVSSITAACAAAALSGNAFACASCGCTLATDVDTLGFSSSSGFRMDLRYDGLDQNQLRSGTGRISPAAASRASHDGDPLEVEKDTRNRYLTLGLDYSPTADWGLNLQLPYIDRSHSTLGTASDGSTPGEGGGQYDSSTKSLGDIKLIGRWQGFSPEHDLGVMLGLKLPTGSHTRSGTSTDLTEPGPVAIDRGLQPGTGTTDLIVGVYEVGSLNQDWDWFGQAMLQAALNTKDDYRPGTGMNLNAGLRYMAWTGVTPQVQLNARHVARDSGAEADTVSTGGTLVYLSPGLSVAAGQKATVYGFVQLPLYQNVNGVQLAPRFTLSVGARYSF